MGALRDEWSVTWRLFWYAAVFAAIVLAVITLVYFLQPQWLGLERRAVTHSHQYIEGRRANIIKLCQEYDENESDIAKYEAGNKTNQYDKVLQGLNTQQDSLKSRIKQECKTLPKSEVPQEARKFLRQDRNLKVRE
jgi:hypothetical protein